MKYVDSTDLEELSGQLTFTTPEAQIVGGVDLYTTKLATSDRRLQRALDQALDARAVDDDTVYEDAAEMEAGLPNLIPASSGSLPYNGNSPSIMLLSPPASLDRKRRANSASLPLSPFGPMNQVASRKQYAYLISVLNANDPDRDFSALQPDQFQREISGHRVSNAVSSLLISLGKRPPSNLWDAIDQHVDVKDSRMYSLNLPQLFLQDEPGAVWARMWFFFNKRRKRVVFLHLKAIRAYSPSLKPGMKTRDAEDDDELDAQPYEDLEDMTMLDEPILGDLD